jgi:hypothetical protein
MSFGKIILILAAVIAIGAFLAPFAAIIYAISVFSLSEIIKGILILYVALIPISVFASPKGSAGD